jgi:O-antigen/teichoic acid export membrane protein
MANKKTSGLDGFKGLEYIPSDSWKGSLTKLHQEKSGFALVMNDEKNNLPARLIFVFWIPLALTWLMMALEGPIVASVIARLQEAKLNLAAYGVAMSVAFISEGPIIMLVSTATALVRNYSSYKKLLRFALVLNGLLTVLLAGLMIPQVFSFLADEVVGLPEEVSRLAYWSMLFFLPWPAAIGMRRFYQGILIRNNRTRFVTYGTITRLATLTAVALGFSWWGNLPGACVGSLSLSAGVVCEAVAIRIMVHGVLRHLKANAAEENPAPLTYREIASFYAPLALTSLLFLSAHSIVTFFVARSEMALESLAVLPVIGALMFIFRSFGLSYQETVIALVGDRFEKFTPIRDFALVLVCAVFFSFGLVVFTDVARLWYQEVCGLSPDLARFALPPTKLLILLPALEVVMSFQRGLMVAGLKTKPVTLAALIEIVTLALALNLAIHSFNMIGAMAAALALVAGRAFAVLFLLYPNVALFRTVTKRAE